MRRAVGALSLASVVGAGGSAVTMFLLSPAQLGWPHLLEAAAFAFFPAFVICFGLGIPALAVLRRLDSPILVYPLVGLALTILVALSGQAFFNSPAGVDFLGLMLAGVPHIWPPAVLVGGMLATAVIVGDRALVKL